MVKEPILEPAPNVKGQYYDIIFQHGAIPEVGKNGCTIREIIEVLIDRLQVFQSGPLKSRENALAITKLQEAKMWLDERERDRRARGVEGKLEP